MGAVARDLDLTESALRLWAERQRADRTDGRTGLTTAERDELGRLRKEVREGRPPSTPSAGALRTERDILKKAAAAFFAKHQGKVRLDRCGEGRVHRRRLLSSVARVAEWLLCLAAAP